MTTVELVHRYEPRGNCAALFQSEDDELVASGPAGTGKSRALMEKMNLAAQLFPGFRGLIVRKTNVSLKSTALVTWKRDVVPEQEAAGSVVFHGERAEKPAQYEYANGSVVVLGGMDRSIKIMSSEYDMIYVQEATELQIDDWEALSTRLRSGVLPFQQLMGDCNPGAPTHWLRQRGLDPESHLHMVPTRHEDNPTLFNLDGTMTDHGRAYMEKLDALTGVRKLRLRQGKWAAAEGQVYEQWDDAKHLTSYAELPDDFKNWPRYWSVDFGFTNPMVVQCWAKDPDGRLVLYREWYQTRTLVLDMAQKVLRKLAPGTEWDDKGAIVQHGEWIEPRPRVVICDHDAEDKATLERALGLSTINAKKSVSDGIQAVQNRLKIAGDGYPRLLICRDALMERDEDLAGRHKPICTQDEVTGYVWDIRQGKPPKEEPVKEDDHGMDAKRYQVMHHDHGGRPRVTIL